MRRDGRVGFLMVEVFAIHSDEDVSDAVHCAVQSLTRGNLVAIPGETTYDIVADAVDGNVIQRARNCDRAGSGCHPLLLVHNHETVTDDQPRISRQAQNVVRRLWPGPLVVSFRDQGLRALQRTLSAPVRDWFAQTEGMRLEAPAHQITQQILQSVPGPLVSLRYVDSRERFISASDVPARVGDDEVTLILDDGPVRYDKPSTIVAFDGDDWSIEVEGVFGLTAIRHAVARVCMFVCTGNTCRSPIAEGLFRRMLSEQLNCHDDELINHGFLVVSAGLSAANGAPASAETVTLLADRGIDLSAHESQPLTPKLLNLADQVYTMTSSHRASILMERPDFAEHVHLLSQDGSDIPDPFGGGIGEYRYCEQMIERNLRQLLAQTRLE